MKDKGYSPTQANYLGQMFVSVFIDKAKVDKNDSEDSVYLGFIQGVDMLLTFDKQMVDAIEGGDAKNYSYLKRFFRR